MAFKRIIPLLILFSTIFLQSCETKKAELKSQSPDGNAQITVSGSKSFMEPWNLTIEIKVGDKTNKMETQLYADEINENNILFSWTDNKTCMLTLIHQDGESRMIEIAI